jgi:hypothetical protein
MKPYLYGSRTRKEKNDPDRDVLVGLVLTQHYTAGVDCIGHLVWERSLWHGISVSRIFVLRREWRGRNAPFLARAGRRCSPC